MGELTRTKDTEPETEVSCVEILVFIGKVDCENLMAAYLELLQPGMQPTGSMLDVLAGVAIRNPYGVVPFLKSLLGLLVPLMHHVKSTSVKVAFSNG